MNLLIIENGKKYYRRFNRDAINISLRYRGINGIFNNCIKGLFIDKEFSNQEKLDILNIVFENK